MKLTPREREVAALIAQGCSNKEIAAQLVIENGTVKTHVGQIMDKLGVRSRLRVALWWLGHAA